MSREYNKKVQERLEAYLEREKLSQTRAAKILGISDSVLSQYRRSCYDKGDIAEIEKRLTEYFDIADAKRENEAKAERFSPVSTANYIPTSISENVYKTIRYGQLEKGIIVIDGDAGVGKTKAVAKFLQDNPNTTVYLKASPATGTLRSLLKMIARALKAPENQRTDELATDLRERLLLSNKTLIIDEAQNLKFSALEEISRWTDEDMWTGKPGVGIVLVGNVEVYNRMLGKQEAMFAQQFNRARLHTRCRTTDVKRSDIELLFPLLPARGMAEEVSYLLAVSRSKWGIRGAVNVYNNAVNAEDISIEGLKRMANTMGIRFFQ